MTTIPESTARRDEPSGQRWRTVGVVALVSVGVAGLVLTLFLMKGCEEWVKMGCANNLKQVGLLCREFAAQNEGNFPNVWTDLANVDEDNNWARLFHCPKTRFDVGSWTNADLWVSYRLLPGRTTNDPPATVLAVEPLAHHPSGAFVLYVNGSVQWWSSSQLLEQTSRPR